MKKMLLLSAIMGFLYASCEKPMRSEMQKPINPSCKLVYNYDSIGIMHNAIVDSILYSNTNINDTAELMDSASFFLNQHYSYNYDFDSAWHCQQVYMDYLELCMDINTSVSELFYFVIHSGDHTAWEIDFLEELENIITSQTSFTGLISALEDLESNVYNFNTEDTLYQIRLLGSIVVAKYSAYYWRDLYEQKYPNWWRILTCDALAVTACWAEISVAGAINPALGAAFAGGAAAVGSLVAYIEDN
jgi:hypothetical protein